MNAFAPKHRRSRWFNLEVRRQGALIIAIPVTCLVTSLIAIACLRDIVSNGRKQEDHSRQVVIEVNRALTNIVSAETGIRAYALTKRPEFLEPYQAAKSNLPESLKKLRSLVQNNPSQAQQIKQIQQSAQERMSSFEQTLILINRLGKTTSTSPQLNAQLVEGKLRMDTLRREIAQFSTEEETRLGQLKRYVVRMRDLTTGFQWFALFFGLIGAGTAWQLFDRLERQLRKREISLQESKIRIQAVVDNAADGIITLDERGNIESFNPAAERIFGYKMAQVTGMNIRQLIAEPAREGTSSDSFNYFLATPTAKISCCQRETTGRREDGISFPMDLAISEMHLAPERLFIAICRDITERQQADETVRSQAQLLDLANDSIIVRDLNDRITYWNQGARHLYGWKSKEILGQEVHTLLKTEFPQPLEAIKQTLLNQGRWEGQLEHTKRDGTKVTVSSRWTLQRDEEGQPAAILEINNDVTERQRWVQVLRDSQQMLQLVMDNIPQFIFWKDCNSVYLGCNDNIASLFDLNSRADIIGLTDYDLPLNREEAERYHALDRQVMETNTPIYHMVEPLSLNLPDRKTIWVDANKVPLTDGAGNVVGILGTFEDITERLHSEAALAESEQRFRVSFEQAAVGMAQANLEGRLIMVNQKLCEIIGYSREELLQMKFQEFTHPDDLNAELESLHQLLAGEIENYSIEKRYIRKDRLPVWVNISVSLLRDSNGEQTLMGAVEDITFRKQAEEALRGRAEELSRTTAILARTTANLKKRNQELDQFAYVVSHDLKAPLRAISNLSSWIEEDLEEHLTEDTRHQMNLLRGRVHRMEALIEALLQYSRVGRIKSALETVSVADLLEDVLDSLAPPASFTVEVEPEMPALETERLLLEQVFANLIGNAIKHNHRQAGHVKISVKDLGDFYEFAVADDGPGIAPEYHEKVFVIFQTLEARDKVENTGIGLSLVKKTVENQGGTVKLASQAGQGATFSFTWPKQPIEHH
ncbi:PAS domain S-box protein [Microcoleus sp. FACHB-672]|uniref:PAS domain S-box protein n=1 Tax=Microcoleus sp. FACHB-672 TaxID=2692825 RepID=UPI0016883413|nr:PAS domain S-box protein [Microcoleus sp. FACHB-672]MBD2042775.1 PAS domain S-box protein [Microcoleus sp. FACHB-672]